MQRSGRLNGVSLYDLYEKWKRLIRFGAVGCINTAVDFLTFSALYGLSGFDKLICQATGYLAGVVNSFVLNKLWTFGDKGSGFAAVNQASKFITVNAFSLLVSLFGLKFFTESLGMNVYIAKVLVTITAQAVNYTGYKVWVFTAKGPSFR